MKVSKAIITGMVSAAAIAAFTPAFAQQNITGVESLDDRIDDLTEIATDDLDKANDSERFGPKKVDAGWRGSVALSASSTGGNSTTDQLTLGGRLSYGAGDWSHNFGVAAEFARANKVKSEEALFGTYEANRYFGETFYIFGIGRYNYDAIGTTEHEAFLGFGPGIRVLNAENTTWRVQVGPGVLYTDVKGAAEATTDVSGIVSSRFYHKFDDLLSLTNDTDVLYSENNVLATNDFGANYKLSENLALRASYRTEYNDSKAIDTDNKVGLSIVLGF